MPCWQGRRGGEGGGADDSGGPARAVPVQNGVRQLVDLPAELHVQDGTDDDVTLLRQSAARLPHRRTRRRPIRPALRQYRMPTASSSSSFTPPIGNLGPDLGAGGDGD